MGDPTTARRPRRLIEPPPAEGRTLAIQVSAGPSLYRRHRPRSFADVVGQEHVVRTLRNAIELGKVHHAYLFVGSRGTGKTSMAKILAACMNCANGPTVEPCGTCEACVAIQNATSLDVIEMDAASNNSVDDIRDAFSAMLMAALDGIQNKIRPGDPLDKDIYDLQPEELANVPPPPARSRVARRPPSRTTSSCSAATSSPPTSSTPGSGTRRTTEIDAVRLRPVPYEF